MFFFSFLSFVRLCLGRCMSYVVNRKLVIPDNTKLSILNCGGW